MTKEEAYNNMIDGYPISHKNFGPDEFLFMDENFIIRDENGDEFESSWDVKTGDMWETDWFIYKNSKNIAQAKLKADYANDKIGTVSYIEGRNQSRIEADPKFVAAITNMLSEDNVIDMRAIEDNDDTIMIGPIEKEFKEVFDHTDKMLNILYIGACTLLLILSVVLLLIEGIYIIAIPLAIVVVLLSIVVLKYVIRRDDKHGKN
jgi:hypothetical protein